jgi:hypothetical protein
MSKRCKFNHIEDKKAFMKSSNSKNKLNKARLLNGFYNIINGERASAGKTLSMVNDATGKQIAIDPDVDRELLNKAVRVFGLGTATRIYIRAPRYIMIFGNRCRTVRRSF